MKRLVLLSTALFIISCNGSSTEPPTVVDSKPNILLILLDDMGYSDMGCYGSEIATPNMDYLAKQGQRFSGYCTAPMCAPTRAMLLSGNDNHIEGMGRMMSVRGNHRNYLGLPHYEEDISDRVVLFPKLLQKAGYYTSMAGKWHLGWDDSSDPYLHGFDDTWTLRNSFANYYDSRNYGISDIKLRDTISMYTKNGKRVSYPVGKHATEVYTDNAISYFNTAKKIKKPFFSYLAYTAPHWPLQVEEKYWEPYLGKYDDGFSAVMKRRLKALKDKGFVPADTPLPAYPDVPKWETLSESERKLLARKMELQAGLIAHLDEHIGKVIQALKDNEQYDNTIIFLLSDHGAGAETFTTHPVMKKIVNDTLINNIENLGKPNSFAMIGKEWAQVCSVPFRKYKGTMYSGGVNAPFIIAGVGIPKSETIRKGFFTVQDIAPTILEIAGARYPQAWEGKDISPLRGQSVLSYFKQQTEQPHPSNYSYGMEHWDDGMIQKGEWKIVNCTDASDEKLFELYNTSKDISEQNDLKDEEPEKYQELLSAWRDFKKEVGVIFLKIEFRKIMKNLFLKRSMNCLGNLCKIFFKTEVIPNINKWEKDGKVDRGVFLKMGELGFLGLEVEERYGGMAADFMYSTVLCEELGRTGSTGFATVICGHAYLAMNYLVHAGSDFIKEKYLVSSVKGEKIGSLALTEAFAGSDLKAIRTTAKLEGDYYVIDGSKTFISNGFYGDYTVAACQTDNGMSMIVIDLDSEGVSKSKLDKVGMRCSDTAELAFNGVKVPKENLLGEEGKGFYYMMQSLQVERLTVVQNNIGLMQYVLDITLQYISERKAFGKTIDKFQVFRHKIAHIASDIDAWLAFMYQTSYRLSLGENVVKECSMLKMKTSDLLNSMVYDCQQMFGGYGFMEEYPIGRIYRDVRVSSIYAGTSEIMAEIISKIVIDKRVYKPLYNS